MSDLLDDGLLSELDAHIDSLRYDYERKQWTRWRQHVDTYNRLASRALSIYPKVFEAVEPVAPLPRAVTRSDGGGQAEMAKMAELLERWHLMQLCANRARVAAPRAGSPDSSLDVLRRIGNRFTEVSAQLKSGTRKSLRIANEYDVQLLFQSLLRLWFDDVRPEEWTPSYAGGSSRLDFLLPSERVVIETKMTRRGLNAKRLGDELLIDIGRYRSHPDCGLLYCFVYDPDGRIDNPRGIESDLMRLSAPELAVEVAVRPARR